MIKSIQTITGAAGTGKTHYIKELLTTFNDQNIKTIVVAPTNRAAKVLRSRGIPAQTIHKALYKCLPTGKTKMVMKPVIDPTTGMPQLIDNVTQLYETYEDEFEYTFNVTLPIDTLIIDESSMVPSHVWQDIVDKFNGDVIAVGDPNQLMPYEDEYTRVDSYLNYFNRLAEVPDINLGDNQDNKRLDSNTQGIQLAINHICSDKNVLGDFPELYGQPGYFYYDMRKNTMIDSYAKDILYTADTIVCWTNNEREYLNNLIRKNKAKQANRAFTAFPIVGDRIIAENAYSIESDEGDLITLVTKGDDLTITKLTDIDVDNNIMWAIVSGLDQPIPISVAHLTGGRLTKGFSTLKWSYGYAMTCHKAQGSGWDTVVVVDSYSIADESAKRWRYTSATRARTNLVILKSGIGFDKRKEIL